MEQSHGRRPSPPRVRAPAARARASDNTAARTVAKNRARLTIPTGLDEENMMTIGVQSHGEAYDDAFVLRQAIDRDLAMIRAQPIECQPYQWPAFSSWETSAFASA